MRVKNTLKDLDFTSFLKEKGLNEPMAHLVYSPVWFYGKDIFIDIVSVLVLLLISFFTLQYYRINTKNKNYLYLTISFFVLAVSFVFKILTNFTIYYHVLETMRFGSVTLTYLSMEPTNILHFIGFTSYRLLTLAGLSGIYFTYQKNRCCSNFILVGLLVLIVAYFSSVAYHTFHLVSLIFMFFITLEFYKNYKKSRNETAKLALYSFAIITSSHLFHMLVTFNLWLYVVGELIQLAGYITLLITFILVLTHAKKKE
jgi:hypothetical protein